MAAAAFGQPQMVRVAALTLPATPNAARQTRRLLEDVCAELRLDGDRRDELLLATTEAVTNAVRHAYVETDGATVEVLVERTGRELLVQVLDQGVGMDGPSVDPGAGFGLRIMDRLARTERTSLPGGGTRVSLRFALAA